MLQQNTTAPLDISVVNEKGIATSLRSLLGSYGVLYFYPKDQTPGCTVEACSFRDAYGELRSLGVAVIGVSADSTASHKNFIAKHTLPFPLWSDPEHKLLEAFGAWGAKKMMGRIFMGINRSTFILDPTGKIVHVWEKVKPDGHAQEVIEVVKKIVVVK